MGLAAGRRAWVKSERGCGDEAPGGSVDVSGLRRGAVRLLPRERGRARRRRPTPRGPAARRSTSRSGWRGSGSASGLLTGLSTRPARAAAGAGARRRGRLDRLRDPDRPADDDQPRRPRYPRACPPTSSTTTARPTPACTEADLPALGPEVTGPALRLLLAGRGAGRRRLWRRSRGANRDRFISVDPNVRPTVEPDMDVWRARLDGAVPAGRPGEDQRRGPRAAAGPAARREAFAADLIGAGRASSSSSPTAARRRSAGPRRACTRRRAPPRVDGRSTPSAPATPSRRR